MPESLLQIGEFAKLASTNLRTLRYYEELGLMAPTQRSQGGFRYYEPEQLDRVAAIKRLQNLGLSLKKIQTIMAPAKDGEVDQVIHRIGAALDSQIKIVDDRLQTLHQEMEELKEAKAKLEECRGCDHTLSKSACQPCARDGKPMQAVVRSLL